MLAGIVGSASAQTAPAASAAPTAAERASASLRANRSLPVQVEADSIETRLGTREAYATGNVRLQQGDVTLTSDTLNYFELTDRLLARGNVRVERAGDRFWGPELSLDIEQYSGEFIQPHYFLARTGAGGQAERVEFLDRSRSRLIEATYTSCPADGTGDPDWLLSADRVSLDIDRNEGVAEGAVLRFLGVPILGLPRMTFPVTNERKSGWLPPNISLDSRGGFGLAVPYYWNLAPNQDLTLTPEMSTRRGPGAAGEWRYLWPSDSGSLVAHLLPEDRTTGHARHAFDFSHLGQWGADTHYAADIQRASDNDYWKDFPGVLPSLTPRLLPQDASVRHRFDIGRADFDVYARVQRWQVLQAADPDGIVPPYERSPQLGLKTAGRAGGLFDYSAETEVNRFTLPKADPYPADVDRGVTGNRWHVLAQVSRRFGDGGWWVQPKAAVNAAVYDTDEALPGGRHSGSRAIPTLSVDAGMVFERDAGLFGRDVLQTLEPRLLYVKTPYRDQSGLPNFDSAPKDFNFVSIFSDNAFSGVDWVSDADQITVGATSRYLDRHTGAELLRWGVAQRYLFRDQRISPVCPPDAQDRSLCDGSQKKLSDLLLLGSSRLWPAWVLDGTVEYNPSIDRSVRSVLSGRYNPAPFHTVGLTYRYARGLSEQFELGWQWPVYRGDGRRGDGKCAGTLYGVGRINYSALESRITDSIVGFEYDAGCWIGRVVAERLSTGRSEATTRLLIQLELVGLSRLGSNPINTLMDNVPGYRLLRDSGDNPAASAAADR